MQEAACPSGPCPPSPPAGGCRVREAGGVSALSLSLHGSGYTTYHLVVNHQLVFAQSRLRWAELLAAGQGTAWEAPALSPQRLLAQPTWGVAGGALQAQAERLSVLSSWHPCEPLSHLVPGSHLCSAGESRKGAGQRREEPSIPLPSEPRVVDMSRPPLSPHHQRSVPLPGMPRVHLDTGDLTWMATPQNSLRTGSWQLEVGLSVAAGTHVRAREGVWGSAFPGRSLQSRQAAWVCRRPGGRSCCARHCHWLGPASPDCFC